MKKAIEYYTVVLFIFFGGMSAHNISAGDSAFKKDVKRIYTNGIIVSLENAYAYSSEASKIAERQYTVDTAVVIMENFGSDILQRLIKSFRGKNGMFLYVHDQQQSAIYDNTLNVISFGPQVWEIENIWSYPGLDRVVAYVIHEVAHTAIDYNKNTKDMPYRIEEQIVNKFAFTQKQQFNEKMNIILPKRRKKALNGKIKLYSGYPDLTTILGLDGSE